MEGQEARDGSKGESREREMDVRARGRTSPFFIVESIKVATCSSH